ncbi:basic helix-loop-helix (bHLH) DNA-binding superfamily protein [Forsythia ovata]|uniref:Basic helix-loop-helix (BHLH) DNA-binding superfamily protein n=1 Tax=Forsythia ovata TaxID=205694 RepID=A0ABD1P2W1_9LAMI
MESINVECPKYWESMFLQAEELDCNYLDIAFSAYDDSSSRAEKQSSMTTKNNIVSERNRRRKLTDKLHALRAVVPKITKLDKESTLRDAIEYIQKLHEEERKIQAEISDLESAGRSSKCTNFQFDQEATIKPIRIRTQEHFHDFQGSSSSRTEVIKLSVSSMGETVIISLTCSKRTDTMVKLNEMFESLNLKIITANITAFSDSILKTIFVQADEKEKDLLKIKIERAIAALNGVIERISFLYEGLMSDVLFHNHLKLQALKAKEAQKKAQSADDEAGKLLDEREGEEIGKKGDSQA